MNLRPLTLAIAATIGVLASLAIVTPAARAAEPEPMRVVDHDLSEHPSVSLVLAGPALGGKELGADDFTLVEAGRELPAVARRLAGDDLDIVLAVDTSGSMAGPAMDAARQAATGFLDSLPQETSVSVVAFGANPTVVLPFTNDRQALRAAVAGLTPEGETALFDALGTSAAQFVSGTAARRAVVLLSDGGDTVSRIGIDGALERLRAVDAQVWTVSLVTPESDHASLARLSQETGGRVVAAGDAAGLGAAYAAIAGDLVGRYQLVFTSQTSGRAPLEITARVDGGDVRTAVELDYPALPAPTAAAETVVRTSSTTTQFVLGAAALFGAILLLAILLLVPSGARVRLARLGGSKRQDTVSPLSGLAGRATAAAERTLERRGQRRGLDTALEGAGLTLRAAELLVLVATGGFAALALGWLLFGVIGAVLFGTIAASAPRLVLSVLRDRRQARFADQLDDVLQLLASSLRAGYGLQQAVEAASREAESPASDELRRATTEVALGRDLGDALDGMAARLGSEDFEWVVQAIRIHREVGGDLAEVLDRVSETIRARNQLRRQVAALSAEGRLSGIILVLLPIGLLGIMALTNPAYIGELGNPTGAMILAAAGALLLAGGLWIRHLVRLVY